MKDYKLSELKYICKKHYVEGKLECLSDDCPITYECLYISVIPFMNLEIDNETDTEET